MNLLAGFGVQPTLLAMNVKDLEGHIIDRPLWDYHAEDGVLGALQSVGEVLWSVGFTKQIFMFTLAGVLTILLFWGYSRKAGKEKVPGRYGIFIESLLTFIRDQMTRPFMGSSGDKYVPVLTTFFTFILICNLLGLIPFFDFLGHGGSTPTGNIVINGGLAICAFVYWHWQGVREQGGVWTYVKNLFPHVPVPILFIIIPVELMAHIVRPLALTIRLFANMLAGHIMLAIFLGFTAVFTRDFLVAGGGIAVVSTMAAIALMFLELLVAVIQAFVFTFLTTVFLAGAVHPEH